MNRTNKEQVLFLVTLLVLGAAGYFKYTDRVSGAHVPSSRTYDFKPVAACPDVRFLDGKEGRFDPKGRNIFAPPRDWFPLDPLRLDPPPGLELDPIWPFTDPALGEEHFDAYSFPFVKRTAGAAGVAAGGAGEGGGPGPERETGEAAAGAGGTAPFAAGTGTPPAGGAAAGAGGAEGGRPGTAVDIGEIAKEKDPEEELMNRYDWILLAGKRDKVFGQILNEDKFALLDGGNKDPITLRRFVARTGKWAETFTYERGRIADFGFARTVANEYRIKKREIIPNAANIQRMQDLARWCLGKRGEDPEAVGFAVEMARMAIEQDPLVGSSYLLLADIYEAAFDLEKELEALKEGMDRGVREPGLYVRYGRFLERYGLFDMAVKAYGDGMAIRPDDAECLLARGGLEMKRGLYDKALADFEEALRSPSLSAERKVFALLEKARALLALDRLADASQETGRAIHLDDSSFEAWNLKGCIAFAEGDYAGAGESFRRALEIAPDDARVAANEGAGLLAVGKIDEALKKFTEAADLDPYSSGRPLAASGFALQLEGETEKALDAYAGAVKVVPDDPWVLYLFGRFQRERGEAAEAVETLKGALTINGRIAAILGELGHACLEAGRFDDAAVYFGEYAKRGAGDYRSLFLQGLVAVKRERVSEALGFFGRAVDAESKAPQPLNGLAMAQYLSGKPVEAMDTFARVMRLFPEDSKDPDYLYASQTSAAIAAHLRKSQWVDRFQRKEIKNGWEVVQRFGPRVFLLENEAHFKGMQRQGSGGELTLLRRILSGRVFRFLEAELKAGETQQGEMGIFVGSYRFTTAQGVQANAEVRLGVDRQGRLLYRVADQGRLVTDWTAIEGLSFPPGEPVKLGIEVADHEEGILRLYANGMPVVDGLAVKKLKKITRNLTLGLFGSCAGGRTLDFTTGYVRIVKTD